MSNLQLIIGREYWTRVKKKSFIIVSLLAPIGMVVLMLMPTLIAMFGSSEDNNIAVVDRTDCYSQYLKNTDSMRFFFLPSDTPEDSLRNTFEGMGFDAYMYINGSPDVKDNIRIYSHTIMTMETEMAIRSYFNDALRQKYLSEYEGHSSQIDSLFARVNSAHAEIASVNISDSDVDKESSAAVGMIVASVSMFLIYMFVLMSGSMVMNSVMDEKTNRIVEIIVSSVRPFDMMMGKIIGIALMMLTQIAIWVVLSLVIMVAASMFIGPQVVDVSSVAGMEQSQEALAQVTDNGEIANFLQYFKSINIFQILTLFIVYFVCGYLLYASLFACIGSVIDSPQDSQQFVLPLTIPIIVALYIAIYALQNPSGDIAFWGSLFPFTSPIVMMARLPFSVPVWQIVLSIAILVASFVFTIWFAGRVYRVGILMYGKKPSMKEIIKWFRQSD